MKPLVLIGAGDRQLYLLLQHILASDGFDSRHARDADETYRLATELLPRAIVLDSPAGRSSAQACMRLKRDATSAAIPIVALIGQWADDQHAELVQAGADECLIRPFAPVQLLDCLRKVIADWSGSLAPHVRVATGRLRYGDIELRLDTFSVRYSNNEIRLSPIEFRLLLHLLENQGQVSSRDELIGAVWPTGRAVAARTVDVHIGRLRNHLQTVTGNRVIRTVRSAGYAADLP